MSTIVIYQSKKTGNTRLVVDELSRRHPDFDVVSVKDARKSTLDFSAYDCVVLASGIYFGFPDKRIRRIAQTQLGKSKPVFSLLTHGSNSDHYKDKWTAALAEMGLNSIGAATCQGRYNFGPFHLVGGMHMDTPTKAEIKRVVTEAEAAIATVDPSAR